jgi:hypothetical protein
LTLEHGWWQHLEGTVGLEGKYNQTFAICTSNLWLNDVKHEWFRPMPIDRYSSLVHT